MVVSPSRQSLGPGPDPRQAFPRGWDSWPQPCFTVQPGRSCPWQPPASLYLPVIIQPGLLAPSSCREAVGWLAVLLPAPDRSVLVAGGKAGTSPGPSATTALPRASWYPVLDLGVLSGLGQESAVSTLLAHTCPVQGRLHLRLFSVPGKKDGEMDRNFDTLDLPKRTEAAKGEWAEAEFIPGPRRWPSFVLPSRRGGPWGAKGETAHRCGAPQKAVQSLGTCCGFRIRASCMGHSRQGRRQRHREARHLQGHTACRRLEGIE